MEVTTHISIHAIRYALAGVVVFFVYLGSTLLLSGPIGLPIAAAIAIAYVIAVVVHFNLQRVYVYRERKQFALSTRQQIWSYVVIGGVQYCITATATAVLPGWLGLSEQVVYVCSAFALSGIAFLLLRGGVFRSA